MTPRMIFSGTFCYGLKKEPGNYLGLYHFLSLFHAVSAVSETSWLASGKPRRRNALKEMVGSLGWGLGFRVQGLGFRGSRVSGLP